MGQKPTAQGSLEWLLRYHHENTATYLAVRILKALDEGKVPGYGRLAPPDAKRGGR